MPNYMSSTFLERSLAIEVSLDVDEGLRENSAHRPDESGRATISPNIGSGG